MKNTFFAVLMALSAPVFAKTYEVKVDGMHCGHCADKMQKSIIEKLTGVKTAKADHKTGTLVIEADDSTKFSKQDIQKAIEEKDEDYKVTKVKTK